jgi:hypothetical protein
MRSPLLVVMLVSLFPAVATATAPPPAPSCYLVTAAELESLLGPRTSGLTTNNWGTGDICSGRTAKGAFTLRLAKEGTPKANAPADGVKLMRRMGAQVDVKSFGPITCSNVIPPKDREADGFNTTCTVTKNGQFGAIEVVTKTRADMVPIDKLKPIAEKIASRMP